MLRHCYILLFILLVASCNSSAPAKTENETWDDSCTLAIPFKHTPILQSMVSLDYSGELTNYRGDDSSRLDFKHFFKKGQLVKSVFYYENGNIEEEFEYKCGAIHGIVKRYYDNGIIAQKIPYRYGRMEGLGEEFDEKGKLKLQVVFKADSIISNKKI